MPEDSASRRVHRLSGESTVIHVHELGMSYGDKSVLQNVSFSVERGEVLALLGPNGAGKSTTIEILEGFRRRSAGEVSVLGIDPAHGDEAWRSRIGIVLQSWRDHAKWRVRELLVSHGSLFQAYATSNHTRPRDADEVLAAVGLSAEANKKVGQLSGGQRRRLDVAIGIIGNPEVLFLDEPTTGFDPEARQDFHRLIADLAHGGQTTILLTTHDLDEAERLSDRIIILTQGQIRAEGTASELATVVAGQTTVSWRVGDEEFSRQTSNPNKTVRSILDQYDDDDLIDLQVTRTSLEDTYIALVQQDEFGLQPKNIPAMADTIGSK